MAASNVFSSFEFRCDFNYKYPNDIIELLKVVAVNIDKSKKEIEEKINVQELWKNIEIIFDDFTEWRKKKVEEDINNYNNLIMTNNVDLNNNENTASSRYEIDVHTHALFALFRATKWFDEKQNDALFDFLVEISSPNFNSKDLFPLDLLKKLVYFHLGAESVTIKYTLDGFEANFTNAKYAQNLDESLQNSTNNTNNNTNFSYGCNGKIVLNETSLYVLDDVSIKQEYYGKDLPGDIDMLEEAFLSDEWEESRDKGEDIEGNYDNNRNNNNCNNRNNNNYYNQRNNNANRHKYDRKNGKEDKREDKYAHEPDTSYKF